ncbi:MAG: class I SAM-dependent methyltransferase [Candidatus Firestonebacteria bacterium]
MSIYREPLYYEIAFNFINPSRQINLFKSFIKRYSKIKTSSFLDIGCGPSPQLLELAKRGYKCTGLDLCPNMLKYLIRKAKKAGFSIETKKANFINFKLKKQFDFAMIMMGTIGYIDSTEKLVSHLKSTAKVLKPGGLYLIENFRTVRSKEHSFSPQTWKIKRRGIFVKVFYKIDVKDRARGLETETILLEVEDHGKKHFLKQKADIKIFSPIEFFEALNKTKDFEFLGWFDRKTLRSTKLPKIGNYTLLRRKD